MKEYLEVTNIIDYHDERIQALAKELTKDTKDDIGIAKKCFEYVRDEIRHSGDHKDNITTATQLLKYSNTKQAGVMPKIFYSQLCLEPMAYPQALPINVCLVLSIKKTSIAYMDSTIFSSKNMAGIELMYEGTRRV